MGMVECTNVPQRPPKGLYFPYSREALPKLPRVPPLAAFYPSPHVNMCCVKKKKTSLVKHIWKTLYTICPS